MEKERSLDRRLFAEFTGNDFFRWVAISEVARSNGAYVAEFVGTFVLVLAIFGAMRHKAAQPDLIIGFLISQVFGPARI